MDAAQPNDPGRSAGRSNEAAQSEDAERTEGRQQAGVSPAHHHDSDAPQAECPFCARIRRGEATHEESLAAAFPDRFPVTKGHMLVVPRRHVASLLDISDEEAADMWRLARRVCLELQEQLGADGFNLGVNVGEAGGQSVPHVHLHVMPRYKGDSADPRGGVRWIVPSRARYWRAEEDG